MINNQPINRTRYSYQASPIADLPAGDENQRV